MSQQVQGSIVNAVGRNNNYLHRRHFAKQIMGAVCCGVFSHGSPILTEAEREERRQIQIDATAARSKSFSQGGGGEKLKAKAKSLEDYEKKNKDLGGPNTLKWNV